MARIIEVGSSGAVTESIQDASFGSAAGLRPRARAIEQTGDSLAVSDEEKLREWMVLYQSGDAAAVEALVRSLSPALLRFCSSPRLSRNEAEDLLQECWLRIHRARHTYLASEPLLPWIYAVARHARFDFIRRSIRLNSREVFPGQLPELEASSPKPDSDVMEMVDQLPDSQREVLLMLKVAGMSVNEVARATSSTAGAVKQKAHRAYQTLRKRFGQNAEGGQQTK